MNNSEQDPQLERVFMTIPKGSVLGVLLLTGLVIGCLIGVGWIVQTVKPAPTEIEKQFEKRRAEESRQEWAEIQRVHDARNAYEKAAWAECEKLDGVSVVGFDVEVICVQRECLQPLAAKVPK